MSIKKFTPPTIQIWGIAYSIYDAINTLYFYVFHKSIALVMCPQKSNIGG